jgi:predicted extracellular nuclease
MKHLATLGLVAASIGLFALVPNAGAAPSAGVMISEVYGGGGNSGATYTQDFIELGNGGAQTQDLTGWSVQYLPGSPGSGSVWQVTALTGVLDAGVLYLVGEATGAGGTQPLPTPDVTGSIAMSATNGTVALVNNTTALTCKTAADCAADSRIVDLVGYGSAVVRESAPVTGASNTTSVQRDTLTDTDNNAFDFSAGLPTPDTLPPAPTTAKIHDIQGASWLSPFDGQRVTGVTGVVTAVRAFGSARGFWLQDPEPDADPATSEGVFVFTGSTTPGVQPGDALIVTATVDEFYPDASPAVSVLLSSTELTGAKWTIVSAGNQLPAAEVLGADTVPVAFTAQPGGDIESSQLAPSQYALDFFESREGMRVEVDDARVVGPTNTFNEMFVTTKPDQNPSARGGTIYSGYDQQNSGRVMVESLIPFAQRPFPQLNVGDVLAGPTVGPLGYSEFGGYEILATQLGTGVDNGLPRETTRRQRDYELAIATYNVENLDPGDPASKFERLAQGVVDNLESPDIVALEEIQDNNGPINDGTVAADKTLDMFTTAIVAAGGPQYSWREIDPINLADGGEPGGNIRVAFLFNPARVSFVDRPGGDATTAVQVLQGSNKKPRLSISPGRIDPTSSAWQDSRKPLVGEFVFNDKTVFVVANHFNSKGGDQPLFGRYQPPARSSEVQRVQQAGEVRAFVDSIRAADSNANVVVLGDLNDFEFSPALTTLTDGGLLTDLVTTLPADERYSYVFEGNSQTLDHVLVRGRMKSVDYDIVHINAEFHDQASDHDPQVVRIKPGN